LSEEIALSAAEISLKHTLPMADAIVYATAMKEACPVVTSDLHFKGLEGVVYLEA
jgi:predicted nucleic acid-binding protein